MEAPVEVYQSTYELERLLQRVSGLRLSAVLEIGSLFGGTLWHWMRTAGPGARIVSVDLLVPNGDERYAMQMMMHATWPAWADKFGHSFTLIEGDSTSAETVQRVQAFAPFDFCFIDGDHRYEAVKADFGNYAPMIRPGGIVALHDIDISEAYPQYYGVRPLWQELKRTHRTEEWIEKPGWLGIGAVYV